MALDFPATPNEGDTHDDEGKTWLFTNGVWTVATQVLNNSNVTMGATLPASPVAGDLHYMTVEPTGLFAYYADANSSQWVQVNGGDIAEPPSAGLTGWREGFDADMGDAVGDWRITNETTLEIWGRTSGLQGNATVVFAKVFADTNYTVVEGHDMSQNLTRGWTVGHHTKTTTGVTIKNFRLNGSNDNLPMTFYAKGKWDGIS